MQISMSQLLIGAVIVLVLVLVASAWNSRERYLRYLGGVWAGEPGFLERAGLGGLQLFVPPDGGADRLGYLIMTLPDGSFVANTALRLRLAAGGWGPAWRDAARLRAPVANDTWCVGAETEFPDLGDDLGEEPFPEQVQLVLSVLDGTLAIRDDEKVYAFLTKDMVATAAAEAAW